MKKSAILTALFSLWLINNALAEWVETFEGYDHGSIAGQTADSPGLEEAWVGSPGAEIVQTDSGKALQINPTGQWTGIAFDLDGYDSPFPGMDGILGEAPGSNLFIGYSLQFIDVAPSNAQAYLGLAEALESEKGVLFGQAWNQANFSGAFGKASDIALDTEPHFVLIHLQRQGGQSVAAKVYLDPVHPFEKSLEQQEPTVELWPREKQAKFLQFKANGSTFTVDDIRIADEAHAVFPQ